MFKLCLFLLCLALAACDSGGGETEKESAPTPAQANKIANPKPTAEQLEQADRILGFANGARQAFDSGYYSLPDALAANARRYLRTWRLAARPKRQGRDDSVFKTPRGLFNDSEAAALDDAFLSLDNAMKKLFGNYAELERYVADKNVKDDGRKGKELTDRIFEAHGQYMAARKSWLEIVDQKASQAEKLLLAGHPLERQMLAAVGILGQFREVGDILATESSQPEMLRACLASIGEYVKRGEKPPFPASPALERPYRQFLKDVRHNYMAALEAGINEGFHNAQRRDLANALRLCQKSYNEFAAAANSGPGIAPK